MLSRLEKEMATHSNILAWRIPGMAEPDGLPSVGLHRVGHDWSNLAGAAGEEEKEAGPHKIAEEMTVINSPRLGKEIVTQVQEMQSPIQDKPKQEYIETYSHQTNKN